MPLDALACLLMLLSGASNVETGPTGEAGPGDLGPGEAAPVPLAGRADEAAPQGAGKDPERDALEARVRELERRLDAAGAASDQAPAAAVPAPDARKEVTERKTLDGFWPIPGTDLSFNIGGYVKLDAIHDFNAIGNEFKLATATIPVPGETQGRTTFNARESRIHLDTRGTANDQDLRVYVEGDFYGDGSTFDLRHAYGQWGGLLAGQTWTTYMDLSSRPHTLDFEGPDAELFIRQPMVRWTQHTSAKRSYSIALEGAAQDITATSGFMGEELTPLPDLTGNVRVEGEGRHVQLSGVLRYLDFEGDPGSPDADTLGWGLAVSGKTEVGGSENRLMGQVSYGKGSARYNQALRGSGSDAVLKPDGDLEALPLLTAVAAYERDWSKTWTSTLALALASVDNLDTQAPGALHESRSASANLVWHQDRVLIGGEYLYGMRENFDGEDGDAHRIQFSFKFLF